jgi:hypothetical protein
MQRYIPIIGLFLLGCPQPTPNQPVVPDADAATSSVDASIPPPVDAAPPIPTSVKEAGPPDSCALGEQNLLKLACVDARGRLIGGPNMHGEPWSQICRDNAEAGVDMKPACIAQAKTCAVVENCR